MTVLPIGNMPKRGTQPIAFSRRRMLQLGAALALSTTAACSPQTSEAEKAARAAGLAVWPDNLPVPEVTHPGYGMYPDYDAIGEVGPWPKILSDKHKRQLEKFSDLILPATDTAPAPSAVGIADFFDDWVSAPYPYMSGTREIVHRGFAWLDAQMQLDNAKDWLGATEAQAIAQLNRMRDAAAQGVEGPLQNPANMYTHLRKLIIGAYYTTPEGEADLGHIVAEAIAGDYPGPTGEALEHIKDVMADARLDWDDLPIGPPPYPDIRPYRFTGDEPS